MKFFTVTAFHVIFRLFISQLDCADVQTQTEQNTFFVSCNKFVNILGIDSGYITYVHCCHPLSSAEAQLFGPSIGIASMARSAMQDRVRSIYLVGHSRKATTILK